ncbi:MAG TPA: hypothetical protein VII06_25575 [Chloroflexota bacterium]|jgi:hypothetical protein
MPAVEYRFRRADLEHTAPYPRVRDALSVAIRHLHDRNAVPLDVTYGGRLLLDAAAIARVYAACRAELEADYWWRPGSLEAAARRELDR